MQNVIAKDPTPKNLEVAALCRENLAEDEAMADWLLEQVPVLVAETLASDMSERARER